MVLEQDQEASASRDICAAEISALQAKLAAVKQKLNKILQFEKNKIPLKKFGKPDDILRLIKFLIYENKWMTGSNIIIDGGKIETVN